MAGLPTGTVTFLFSDVEGSTRLLQEHPDSSAAALEMHHEMMRDSIAAYGGTLIRTEGDGVFAVFEDAAGAVGAAVAAQRAHHAATWPGGALIKVRIGLHTGRGTPGGDDYVGIDVHRAARIADAGHGGQIVVSDATRALAAAALPEGAEIIDAGEHRLADIARTEHLHLVMVAGLPADHRPLRTRGGVASDLPHHLTSFVERPELDRIIPMIREHRLVTLTGPGGTGKSRLAVEAAGRVADEFDAVSFVPLASIRDPDLVASRILVRVAAPPSGLPPVQQLAQRLGNRRWLLVLDNFEQVLAAAPVVGEVLASAPRVAALVTSRAPLRLSGEREFPVPPLPLPPAAPNLAALASAPSTRLFVDRARSVRPDFRLDESNAAQVAEIVTRLDGLPLALELAAAGIKLLSPEALARRLTTTLDLAGSGRRDAPERQRTLRSAIGWSYDLLSPGASRMLRTLAVFSGGAALRFVEDLFGSDPGLDVLSELSALADHSLITVREADGDTRFEMLGTVHDFAWERLVEGEDAASVRDRHLSVFRDLAEAAAPLLTTERQAHWLNVLERERDNLWSALDWAVASGRADDASRLVAALWRFWHMRGPLREGRDRIEEVLALEGASPRCSMTVHEAAGGLAYWGGDLENAERHYREALRLARSLDDRRAVADALYNLAFPVGIQDRPDEAAALHEEALRLAEGAGDRLIAAKVRWAIGDAAYTLGDLDSARVDLERALDALAGLDEAFMVGWAHRMLGTTLMLMGEPAEARTHFEAGLRTFAPAGDASGVTLHLLGFAKLAELEGDPERMLVLMGATEEWSQELGLGLTATFPAEIPDVAAAAAAVGDERAASLLERGRGLSLEDAAEYALGGPGGSLRT